MIAAVGIGKEGVMLPEIIRGPVLGLFSICVTASAIDLLVGDGRSAGSLRALCAISAAICAIRTLRALIAL